MKVGDLVKHTLKTAIDGGAVCGIITESRSVGVWDDDKKTDLLFREHLVLWSGINVDFWCLESRLKLID